MKYLVDSDWAIHHLRGSRSVTDELKQRIADGISISIISVAELYHGVYRARDPELAKENLLTFLTDLEIVGLNEEISNLFGRERARLQLLCAHCSSLKGNRPMQYLRAQLARVYV